MADPHVREAVGERVTTPVLSLLSVLATAAATWFMLDREPRAAGWAALAAGVALVAAGVLLQPRDRRARVVVSFADRIFDGCVLASLAWVTRTTEPAIASGALVALSAGFLASYIRAKGGSLGYGVEEGIVTPALRYGLVSLSLIAAWAAWAIWTVAILAVLSAGVRATQVAKEERV